MSSEIKLYLFGTGVNSDKIESVMRENVSVILYLDNDREKQNTHKNGKEIVLPLGHHEDSFDYVVIASMQYEPIRKQLVSLGYQPEKIVSFFDMDSMENTKICNGLFDPIVRMELCMAAQINRCREAYERKIELLIRNMPYEIKDQIDTAEVVHVHSVDDTLNYILREKCCVARFGDGEFDLMQMRDVERYQKPNPRLTERLLEVLQQEEKGLIVCIGNNYGALDVYNEAAAENIRRFMDPASRAFQYSLLNLQKTYYNTNVTRLYSIMNDAEKEKALERFERWKSLWEGRRLTIIEGRETRMGVGNDLFDNAAVVQRIIAPSENAFDRYDEILNTALTLDADGLILIALGPSATVLAYDLYKKGYWAIDSGHLDMEYEWACRHQGDRACVPYKYNNELSGGTSVMDIHDEQYEKQIIARCD